MTMEKSFINLKQIVEYTSNFFSLIGLFLNITLLYLIITKTSNNLREYRRVLLQNCIVDLFYNFIQLLTSAGTDYKNGNFFIIITNIFGHWSPQYLAIFIHIWVMALFSTLMTLPVQFVYRYFLIVKNKKLSNHEYTVLLLISLFFSSTYTFWCLFVTWPREPSYTEMTKLIMSDIYFSKEIPNFVTADIKDWPLFVNFVWVYVMAGFAYTIIIWSSYEVWKHLKANEHHMSSQTKDANRQISKTLIMQATLPVIVCLIPIAFTVTMVFSRANIDGIGLIFSLFFAWIPTVNTITTMVNVKTYRDTILKFLKRPNSQKHVITITAPSTYVKETSRNVCII